MSHLTGAGLTVVIRVGEARVVLERLPQELTHCTTHSTPQQSLPQVSHTVELTHCTAHSTPRQSLQQLSHAVELTHRTTHNTPCMAVTSTGRSYC